MPWEILAGVRPFKAGLSCGHTMAVLAQIGKTQHCLGRDPRKPNLMKLQHQAITTQGLLILYMMSNVVNLNVRCDCSQSKTPAVYSCLDYLFRARYLLRIPSPCLYLTNRKISLQNFAITSWVPFIWKVGSSSNTRKSDSARTATVRSLGRLRSNRS
jgi:hypothetical protein